MKRLYILFFGFFMFSCLKSDIVQHIDANTDPAILPNGLTFNFLSANYNNIGCGPGWGRKGCYFLNKYNGTIWADSDNYYSAYSDIKFSLFQNDTHFISFFNIDSVPLIVKGGKKGKPFRMELNGILGSKKMSGMNSGLIINIMGLVMKLNIR